MHILVTGSDPNTNSTLGCVGCSDSPGRKGREEKGRAYLVGARRRRLAWGRRGEGRRRPPRPRLQESINQEKERGEPEEEIYIFNSF
jgi:hypothetical protein